MSGRKLLAYSSDSNVRGGGPFADFGNGAKKKVYAYMSLGTTEQ